MGIELKMSSRILVLAVGVVYLALGWTRPSTAQNILDRFRPAIANESRVDDPVQIVYGTKVKRFDRLTIPLGGTGRGGIGGAAMLQHPIYQNFATYATPRWQAQAMLKGEGEAEAAEGMITFLQLPYNNDIKVTLNVTGLPVGKHALHIHTYGDVSDGCKSTGGQFPNNFIGNVDTKEDGSISAAFLSVYLQLFGFNGIVGRSIVIHSKPIDLNTALNAEVFSSSLQPMPDAIAFQNEENSVGPPIACGVISIVGIPPAMATSP